MKWGDQSKSNPCSAMHFCTTKIDQGGGLGLIYGGIIYG